MSCKYCAAPLAKKRTCAELKKPPSSVSSWSKVGGEWSKKSPARPAPEDDFDEFVARRVRIVERIGDHILAERFAASTGRSFLATNLFISKLVKALPEDIVNGISVLHGQIFHAEKMRDVLVEHAHCAKWLSNFCNCCCKKIVSKKVSCQQYGRNGHVAWGWLMVMRPTDLYAYEALEEEAEEVEEGQ